MPFYPHNCEECLLLGTVRSSYSEEGWVDLYTCENVNGRGGGIIARWGVDPSQFLSIHDGWDFASPRQVTSARVQQLVGAARLLREQIPDREEEVMDACVR